MQELNELLTVVNGWLWGYPMIIMLLATHLFLTIRLRFPQRHLLKAIRLSVTRDRGSAGDVSQFSALATSLAGTIGTGNIIGGHGRHVGRTGRRVLVLADGHAGHCHQVC